MNIQEKQELFKKLCLEIGEKTLEAFGKDFKNKLQSEMDEAFEDENGIPAVMLEEDGKDEVHIKMLAGAFVSSLLAFMCELVRNKIMEGKSPEEIEELGKKYNAEMYAKRGMRN